MAKVTMELNKELREKTQVGMMDCKKALIESEGDVEKAIELLRKKGAAVALKRAGNETNNGNIDACMSGDLKSGVLIKIGCETDFSANTDDMKSFAQNMADHILENKPTCVSDGDNCLMDQSYKHDKKLNIQEKLNELIAKIGEKVEVAEFDLFNVENHGIVNAYIHPGSNMGVMVQLDTDKNVSAENIDKLKSLSRDICMQIAVTSPLCIDPSQLDASILEKEKTIIKEQLVAAGKPEKIIDKITEGKIQKYYQDVCLLKQNFIKNDKLTIQNHINQVEKDTGLKIEVKKFKRFSIGK